MTGDRQGEAVAYAKRPHLCAETCLFGVSVPSQRMVSEDQIREEGLTRDEVLDRELVEPQQEVEWLPEWDEYPEERPGENTRIEDNTLIWERDDFEARLESYETTHWRATVDIPEWVGKWHPREIDMKCLSVPEYGMVESVKMEGYTASKATLVIQENFQPVFEVNHFIDTLIESAERSEEYTEEVEAKLAAASENTE